MHDLLLQASVSPFASGAVFLDFKFPTPTTWFYFSMLLAVALFFKFSRLFSVRNLDVLTLFLLVPGLLLLKEDRYNWYAYLWLFCGSGYFLFRCFLDLTLVRRPALSPNLKLGGLAWLAGALYVCLVAAAMRQPVESPVANGKSSPMLEQAQLTAEGLLQHQMGEARDLDLASVADRALALTCHLLVAAGLVIIGWRHFQDLHGGMAAATFYLLLPYIAIPIHEVNQWRHVWPSVLFVWAIVAYRKPTLAGLLLGLAAGTNYFPVLAVPVWASFYGKRGIGRFTTAFVVVAGVCLGAIGLLLHLQSIVPGNLQDVFSPSDWLPWIQPTADTEGFWNGVPWAWAYRIPVFAAYLALLLVMAIWPSPKDLAHLLALSAAAVIGVQFWYAEKGGVYVLWYLPLLLLLVFRPNLSDRFPPTTPPGTDWLSRFVRFVGRVFLRFVKSPEPLARVQ